MNCARKMEAKLRLIGTVALCVLIFLCLSFAGQLQKLKVLPLGIVCFCGFLSLICTRGRAIDKRIWCWLGAYILYNLIWSILGFANHNPGASNYFRVGVIWSIIFVFIVAAFNKTRIKILQYVLFGMVAWQVLVVLFYVGHMLQLWPNFLEWLYPNTTLGIHVGYFHIVNHHLGALAFEVPFIYAVMVLDTRANWKRQTVYAVFWLFVVFAAVATSRRMLYIVLFACAAAIIAVPLLLKKDRKLLFRCILGLMLTAVYFGASVLAVTQVTKNFLIANYDELIVIAQGREVEDGNVKYTKNIVFNPFSLEVPKEEESHQQSTETTNPVHTTEPSSTETEPSSTETEPSSTEAEAEVPDNKGEGLEGFTSRVEGMVNDMQEGSVRGNIMSSVMKNWGAHPWFGVGFGADLPGLPPNSGIYEMEYAVRLYTTGLIGLTILLGLMLYVGITPLQYIKKVQGALFLVPITLAYLGAVLATISNPYIFSGFDYLFMIFMPIAYLNCCKTEPNDSSELK